MAHALEIGVLGWAAASVVVVGLFAVLVPRGRRSWNRESAPPRQLHPNLHDVSAREAVPVTQIRGR